MDDKDVLMDHVALECMHAIEKKDKSAFLDSFKALVADVVEGMMGPEMDEGEE